MHQRDTLHITDHDGCTACMGCLSGPVDLARARELLDSFGIVTAVHDEPPFE
ncbi:hypothetical protein [Tsukamurella pulmonis]|uniref:hypothetical protein n=1 Tax=Tsukamurella pulmonis TaxID=47312 RepID=UPI001402A3E7|nr:hypothetical protein [Tsukamurella pulmonis]